MNLPQNVSEAVKRRNPHLYANSPHLDRLQDRQSEQDKVSTLVKSPKARRDRKSRVVVRIAIVSVRQKLLDTDNLVAGAKPIRDSIARSLAVDDADPRIEWEYHQIKATGTEGTAIKIDVLYLCLGKPLASRQSESR